MAVRVDPQAGQVGLFLNDRVDGSGVESWTGDESRGLRPIGWWRELTVVSGGNETRMVSPP